MVKVTRRNFLKAGIAAGAVGLGAAGYKYAPEILSERNRSNKPNIVFVTLDTTRYDRMGFNGYGRDTTPNLDKYAENGVVFHRNYSQAPYTPFSTASFLTSQYPPDMGFDYMWSSVPSSALTIAEMLKTRGYATHGATSTKILDATHGFSRGFDSFSSPELTLPFLGTVRIGEKTVDTLIANLEKQPREDKPHFFWLHLYDPHGVYLPHKGFTDRFKTNGNFDDKDMKVWSLFALDNKKLRSAYDLDYYSVGHGENILTEKEVVDANDQYDGEILYADHQTERLLNYLSERELFDLNRDLLVVNADHGELMGEHLYCTSHHGSYQEVKHTPLLFTGAGLSKGKTIYNLTENVDILPTILEIVDSNSNKEFDSIEAKYRSLIWRGRNLLRLIGGDISESKEVVFTDLVDGTGYSLNTKDFSITSRRLASDKPHKDLERIAGYFPQGAIKFSDFDLEKGINLMWTLKWPGLNFEDSPDVFTKVSVSKVGDDDSEFLLFNSEVPYKGNSFKFFCPQIMGEDKWNETAPYALRWKVQIVSRKNGNDDVLFDSKEDGNLEFRLEPTENFSKLFDLNNDPKEDNNLWDNPSYSGRISELDKKIDLILAKRMHRKGKASDINDEDRATLKALGYL